MERALVRLAAIAAIAFATTAFGATAEQKGAYRADLARASRLQSRREGVPRDARQ
jgi:hypothetical protein